MGVVSVFIAYFQLNAVIASVPAIARLKIRRRPATANTKQLGTISSGLALVTASMDVAASGAASVLGKASFANLTSLQQEFIRCGWRDV